MPWTSEHLTWLQSSGRVIQTACGKSAPVFEFHHDMTNDVVVSEWARHFRNHYCSDNEIEVLKPADMDNSEYLLTLKFPHSSKSPGPSIRAGDFAEILVADYLNFIRNYYVPRTRYDRKIIGNESSKGSDVVGFKLHGGEPQRNDELIVYEVKATLSENNPTNTLQKSIDDSSKDEIRLAETLNGMKQRLYDRRDDHGVGIVNRFQQSVDKPYKRLYGAAAVVSNSSFCVETLAEADSSDHVAEDNLELIVIAGEHLMPLVHALYERAANEA